METEQPIQRLWEFVILFLKLIIALIPFGVIFVIGSLVSSLIFDYRREPAFPNYFHYFFGFVYAALISYAMNWRIELSNIDNIIRMILIGTIIAVILSIVITYVREKPRRR